MAKKIPTSFMDGPLFKCQGAQYDRLTVVKMNNLYPLLK